MHVIHDLPLADGVVLGIFATCVIGGGLVLLYVAALAALDCLKERRRRRLERDRWFAEQARIYRDGRPSSDPSGSATEGSIAQDVPSKLPVV